MAITKGALPGKHALPATKKRSVVAEPIDDTIPSDGDVSLQSFESILASSGHLVSESTLGPRVALYLIQRIASSIHKAAEKLASRHGLHVTDLYVLLLLQRAQPDCIVAAGELQKALSFTSGGMTRRLDRLQERGLLERIPSPTDRRAWLIGLTESGRVVADDIRANTTSHFSEPYSELSKSEWNVLVDCLQRIDRQF